MVEGAFARAFRSELQPVEVASAVQREMDDRAAIVAKGRTLVPNDFVVELADSDHERLDVYAESLGGELRLPASDLPRTQGRGFPGHPRLLVSGPGAPGGPAGGEQHTYELQTPVTLLGRGTDCDLRLVDPGVSRHHAELRVENDQVVLVDLSSTNGTFVNGQPVRRVALIDGTHISLGRTTLIFRQDGQDREDGQGTAYSRTTY